jgi:hypothetical protein
MLIKIYSITSKYYFDKELFDEFKKFLSKKNININDILKTIDIIYDKYYIQDNSIITEFLNNKNNFDFNFDLDTQEYNNYFKKNIDISKNITQNKEIQTNNYVLEPFFKERLANASGGTDNLWDKPNQQIGDLFNFKKIINNSDSQTKINNHLLLYSSSDEDEDSEESDEENKKYSDDEDDENDNLDNVKINYNLFNYYNNILNPSAKNIINNYDNLNNDLLDDNFILKEDTYDNLFSCYHNNFNYNIEENNFLKDIENFNEDIEDNIVSNYNYGCEYYDFNNINNDDDYCNIDSKLSNNELKEEIEEICEDNNIIKEKISILTNNALLNVIKEVENNYQEISEEIKLEKVEETKEIKIEEVLPEENKEIKEEVKKSWFSFWK